MAWIRTSLSLISFGFGIDSIVSAIRSFQAAEALNPLRLSRILGLAFIALGTYAMIFAAIKHRQELLHIQRHSEYLYTPRRSLGLVSSRYADLHWCLCLCRNFGIILFLRYSSAVNTQLAHFIGLSAIGWGVFY